MNATDILKDKGLKKTAQRIMLVSILQRRGISLTEGEIRTEMGELYDRVTFYRTVQTLLNAGIMHRITVGNITVKYALNDSSCGTSDNHIHLFCKRCHTVICLEHAELPEYRLPSGFRAEESEVLIKGLCARCESNNC